MKMPPRESLVHALRMLGIAHPRPLRFLGAAEVAELLRARGAAHLWVTDVFGDIHRKIEPQGCFRFWKTELKALVLEDGTFIREQWPDRYAYQVSEWISPFKEPLLEVRRWE